MFRFLKKQAAPLTIAEALLPFVVGTEEANRSVVKMLRDSGLDEDGVDAAVYPSYALRMAAVTHITVESVRGEAESHAVLDALLDLLERNLSADAMGAVMARLPDLLGALGASPPPLTAARQYAQLCGDVNEIGYIMVGEMEWVGIQLALTPFFHNVLKEFRIVP